MPLENGFDRIQTLGFGCVARKRGVAPPQTPLTRSASAVTLDELNLKLPAENSDLNSTGNQPESVMVRRDYRDAAGAVEPAKRRQDTPEAFRCVSLEHQVHRRHSAPPRVDQRWKGSFTYIMADLADKISAIGRDSRSAQPSPTKDRNPRHCSMDRMTQAHLCRPSSASTHEAAYPSNSDRSCGRNAIKVPPLILPPPTAAVSDSWMVDDFELDSSATSSFQETTQRQKSCKECGSSPFEAFRHNSSHGQQEGQAAQALTAGSSLTTTAGSSLTTTAGSSLTTTAGSSLTTTANSSWTTTPLIRPRDISSSIIDVIVSGGMGTAGFASGSRLLNSRAAHMYEQHVKDMVLKEQKKAMRRAL